MNSAEVRWPNSLWAAATPAGPDLPELIGAQQADVIVIGAGFTGLSTALHLREAGVDVTATRYEGIIHGFVMLNALRGTNAAGAAIAQAIAYLRSALA